jgi:hypothetical protein
MINKYLKFFPLVDVKISLAKKFFSIEKLPELPDVIREKRGGVLDQPDDLQIADAGR